MKRLMTALVVGGLSFGPAFSSVAFAQSVTEQVEALSGQAASAYRDGDYEKAIELFKEAYALQAVPNLLFNIAKVYEKLEKWDEAVANYKEFIKAPDADAAAREAALARIDALEEVQEAELAAKKAEEERLAEEERQRQLAEQKKGGDTGEGSGTETAEGGSDVVPWIVAGAGVGLLVGGGVFGLLASDQETVFKNGETPDDRRAARRKGLTYAVAADSMFAAGAIATTVGIILFATSGADEEAAQESAALPFGWVGDGNAGVGMSFSF